MRSSKAGGVRATMLAVTFVTSVHVSAAEPKQPGRPATTPVALDVDLAASRAYIKVGSDGRFGHEHGVQGRLAAGKLELGGAGELTFDMRSFVCDTPEARKYVGLTGSISAADQKKTTANMQSTDVLDAARHATASYTIVAAVPADGQTVGDPGRYQLEGRLTLRGAVQPLNLTALVEPTTTPGLYRMRCAFAISQAAYGIKPYSALGGLVSVADRLDVWGELMVRASSH